MVTDPSQRPFRIELPPALMEEIRRSVVDAFYSVPRGGVEIGGVLFGSRGRTGVQIAAWRPIGCEYASGPSFVLSDKDQSALTGLLAEAKREPALTGLETVGWFHSHTRSDLTPRQTDLETFNRFFGQRGDIALLVRPQHLQSTRAAFLVRNLEGKIESAGPEFTIDAALSRATLAPEIAAPLPAAPNPVPPPAAAAKRTRGAGIWIVAALCTALVIAAAFAARSYQFPAEASSLSASRPLMRPVAPAAAIASKDQNTKDQIIEDLEKQAAQMRTELLDQQIRSKRLERRLAAMKRQQQLSEQKYLQ